MANFKYSTKIISNRLIMTPQLQERVMILNGKDVEVSIEPPRKPRSLNENRYYWFIINMLSDELGYSPEEIHEICKYRFLKEFIEIRSVNIILPKSTAELSTIEFESYLSKIRQWASIDLNIYLPEPNEYLKLEEH